MSSFLRILLALCLFDLLTDLTIVHASSPAAPPPVEVSQLVAVIGGSGASLLDEAGEVIKELAPGSVVTAVGRSHDDRWLEAEIADDTQGWLAMDRVIVVGAQRLPSTVIALNPPDKATDADVEEHGDDSSEADDAQQVESIENGPEVAAIGRVSLTNSRLNVRTGPSTGNAVVGKVEFEDRLEIVGTTSDQSWLQILYSEDSVEDDADEDDADEEEPDEAAAVGWVATAYVIVGADVATLPVIVDVASNAVAPAQTDSDTSPTATAPVVRTAPTAFSGKLVLQGPARRHDLRVRAGQR